MNSRVTSIDVQLVGMDLPRHCLCLPRDDPWEETNMFCNGPRGFTMGEVGDQSEIAERIATKTRKCPWNVSAIAIGAGRTASVAHRCLRSFLSGASYIGHRCRAIA